MHNTILSKQKKGTEAAFNLCGGEGVHREGRERQARNKILLKVTDITGLPEPKRTSQFAIKCRIKMTKIIATRKLNKS